jgi:peroxiredoxin
MSEARAMASIQLSNEREALDSKRARRRHAAGLLIAAAMLGACAPATSPSSPANTSEKTQVKAEAAPGRSRPPDFELPKLGGGTLRLSDHLGKDVVLIDFWATFCEPCLTALPHLEKLYRKHQKSGFVILGVTIDGPDSISQVRAEVMKLGLTFPILLDQETRAMALYNPKTAAPYSVLIGRGGAILRRREGYSSGDGSPLDSDVERALATR